MGFVGNRARVSERAQGITEYLTIVVVIIVISIAAITLFVTVFEGGAKSPNLTSIQNKQYWSTQTIALADAMVDENGDAVFVLTNNTEFGLRLIGYKVDENEFTISGNGIVFNPKEQKAIFFPDIGVCPTSNGCAYDKILFYYSPLNQTQKLISGGEALVLGKKDNVTWNFEGINNVVCVAQGEVQACQGGSSLPDYTGQDGNCLKIVSGALSWGTCGGGGAGLTNPVTMDLNVYKSNPSITITSLDNNLGKMYIDENGNTVISDGS
ncbi:MAG: hypothetical protein WCW44_04895 [archaeon]|jgi:hypothetical protein